MTRFVQFSMPGPDYLSAQRNIIAKKTHHVAFKNWILQGAFTAIFSIPALA
jgi:hypothetical protein